ncbi:MAG TPA: endonuclease/exonuclease/phosphatase family protein [Streptosporangiaceae bacterium]
MTGELRVLHWNIHSWLDAEGRPNAEAVIALIGEIKPDVVSLVEVNEPWGAPATLARIAAECGYSWIFGPCLEYATEEREGGYGNALLTREPVTAVHQWRVFSPARLYDGSEQSEPRMVLLARLAGTGFWVGSTHFPASDPDARRDAGMTLQRLVQVLDGPWLICGDFNAEPSSCFFEDGTFAVSRDLVRPTYPAGAPVMSIDYCIARPGLVMSTTALPAAGSDHLPVLTTVRAG